MFSVFLQVGLFPPKQSIRMKASSKYSSKVGSYAKLPSEDLIEPQKSTWSGEKLLIDFASDNDADDMPILVQVPEAQPADTNNHGIWTNDQISSGNRNKDNLQSVSNGSDQFSSGNWNKDNLQSVSNGGDQLSSGNWNKDNLQSVSTGSDQLSSGNWNKKNLQSVSNGGDQLRSANRYNDHHYSFYNDKYDNNGHGNSEENECLLSLFDELRFCKTGKGFAAPKHKVSML